MNRRSLFVLMFLVASLLLSGCAGGNKQTSITINGSTTLFPIVQKAAEVYMSKNPNVTISVEGTGSGNGLSALIDGTTDIAMSSRKITEEEVNFGASKDVPVNINEIPVAMDALTIIVNPSNPINGLSTEQVKKIFLGEITNWKDVGGSDTSIVVVSRDTSSGTYESFLTLALGKDAKITDKAIMQASNQTVKNVVASTDGSIGYIGLGYVDTSVKPLVYDGVAPNKDNVLNNTYKMTRKLFFYTDGNPEGAVKGFVDFMLSDEGQSIVESVGFIRINK